MGCLLRLAIAVAALPLGACVVDASGDYESLSGSGSGGSGGSGSGSSGFPPDEMACDYELGANPLGSTACGDDLDCCAGPTVSLDFACPSTNYPNNWSCVNDTCVHGGCTTNDDCGFPGFVCLSIANIGHCVAPCTTTAECADAHNMPDSTCETVGTQKFCMQPQP